MQLAVQLVLAVLVIKYNIQDSLNLGQSTEPKKEINKLGIYCKRMDKNAGVLQLKAIFSLVFLKHNSKIK